VTKAVTVELTSPTNVETFANERIASAQWLMCQITQSEWTTATTNHRTYPLSKECRDSSLMIDAPHDKFKISVLCE